MLIEDLLGDLLVRHNCVVIPMFGGFVTGEQSALFDSSRGVIIPPRKSLLFNKQLINNDGLLIAAYAHVTTLCYTEAAESINLQVNNWRKLLELGERITIERVGFLYIDDEKNIGFEQDRFSNLLLNSLGLGKVHFVCETDFQLIKSDPIIPVFVPETENTYPILPINEIENDKNEGDENPNKTNSLLKYVAAAALIPLCFYTYWIPMKTNALQSGIIAFRDFNPFEKEIKPSYTSDFTSISFKPLPPKTSFKETIKTLPTDVNFVSLTLDSETFIPVRVKNVTTDLTAEEKKTLTPTPVRILKQKQSFNAKLSATHLVVGCFTNVENANKMISNLKINGLNAYIIDAINGLYRVSACKAKSTKEITSAKETLDSLNIKSWILIN